MTAIRRVVQVEVHSSQAELAADVLWQGEPSAVSQEDLPGGRVRLTADLADPQRLSGLPEGSTVQVLEIDGDAHLDAWRAWAVPVHVGRGIVLHPAWLPRSPGGDELVILNDPGRAFGSGSHPSTRLVVAALEEHVSPGDRVLDVGTGSGVLAVAARLLGAALVVGIDVDPAAIAAAEANAAANGVSEHVTVSAQPLADVAERFDVVMANIGLRVLRELSADLRARLRPGGLLILSGLLEDQADAIVACFPDLTEVVRPVEEGWAAVVLRASR